MHVTSVKPSVRQRSPRGQGGRVRDELIDAAEALLSERGSAEAVTVADIVRRVGVTAPVLYSHFADKDDLFVAVHTRRLDDFRDTLRRAGRRASSPLDALERRGRAYVRYALAKRDAYIALFMTPGAMPSGAFTDPSTHDITAYLDLVDNVRACMDDGSIPARDPEIAARVVWMQVHGLASMLITMPEVTHGVGLGPLVDGVMAAITEMLVSGSYAPA
jgi:AcrR family transcriptional regulator